jgi:hypothetical protein
MGFGSGEGFTPGRNHLVGDFTVEGQVSSSYGVTASFYYGDGSFLQNVTGSGGAASSIGVGNDVDSGTANRVLYENSSNDLAESANLTFDGTTLAAGATTVSTLSASSNLTGSTLKLEHGLTASSILLDGASPTGQHLTVNGITNLGNDHSSSTTTVKGNFTASSGLLIQGPPIQLTISSALDQHSMIEFRKGDISAIPKRWLNIYTRQWVEPGVRVGNADGRVEIKLPHVDLPGPSVGSDNTSGDRGFLFHNAQTSSYASFKMACTTSVDYIDFGFTDRESSTPAIRILGNGKITVDCGNVDTAGTYAGTSSPAVADNQFLLQSSQINFGTASNCIVNVTGGLRVTPGAGSHDPTAGYVSASSGLTASSLQISDGSRHYGMTNEGNLGVATVTGSGVVSNIEMPYITASMGALFKRNADNVDQSPLVAISGASGEGDTSDHQAALWVSGSGVNSNRGVVHIESHGPYTVSLLTRNDNTNIIYRAGQGLDDSGNRQPKSETNIAFKMAPPADIGGGGKDLSRTWALGVDCQEADYRRFRITNKSGVAISSSSDYGFVGTGSFWGFNLNNPAHTLDINGGLCVTGSTILGTDATGSVNVVGNFFVNQATEATLADNTDALTIAQMLGRLAKITPTTSRSKATPTAAQIVAGIALPTVDQAWDFTVINLAAGGSGNKLTLTAGDGAVTLVGSMELNDDSSGTFRVRLTNVSTEAVTIYRIS